MVIAGCRGGLGDVKTAFHWPRLTLDVTQHFTVARKSYFNTSVSGYPTWATGVQYTLINKSCINRSTQMVYYSIVRNIHEVKCLSNAALAAQRLIAIQNWTRITREYSQPPFPRIKQVI